MPVAQATWADWPVEPRSGPRRRRGRRRSGGPVVGVVGAGGALRLGGLAGGAHVWRAASGRRTGRWMAGRCRWLGSGVDAVEAT